MARRRDYPAEARRRNELARSRGFRNYWAQRNAPRYPRSGSELGLLPELARERRTDALRVISKADAQDITIEEASRVLRVPRAVVDFYAGEAQGPTRRSRTYATETDELFRARLVIVDGEVTFVEAHDRAKAKEAERIFDVQWRYIHGRASQAELDRLPRTFNGRRVVREGAELRHIANTGQLGDTLELYKEFLQ
jgi:hypothetical protein